MEYTMFVYGTLMFPQVRKALGVNVAKTEEATVYDYDCRYVTGEEYPAMFFSEGKKTSGLILYCLSQADKDAFDLFEGGEYVLTKVIAILKSNVMEDCFAYVYKPLFMHAISLEQWDVAKADVRAILNRYCGNE